jgi:hypothetical protein|eukprot:gene12741-13956_t
MLVNLLHLLAFLALAFAEKSGPALNWKSVAIDASGKFQVAAAAYNNDLHQGYPIYLSDNYGVSWRQSKSPEFDWVNVYSDSTGQTLIAYATHNSSYIPPLQISTDRGNTWTDGAYTSGWKFTSEITGDSNSTLWTVLNPQFYYSSDIGKNWHPATGFSDASVLDGAVDSTGYYRYVVTDYDGFFASYDGQNWQLTTLGNAEIFTSVETDPTGQYVFVLNSKTLKYSTDYAHTWTDLQNFAGSGSPVVIPTFLKITSDHKFVYMLQKSSSSSPTTNLVRFTVSSKTSTIVFSTNNTVNDVAISATSYSMIVSTNASAFYTTKNSGITWMTHTISA